MHTKVGAYEAKTKLPELLRRVEAGERFTITHRGHPIAELCPAQQASKAEVGDAVSEMQAFRRIRGVSRRTLRTLIDEGKR